MKKVLLIGACGYIGTKLWAHLESKYNVEGTDIEWYGNVSSRNNRKIDFANITKEELKEYTHIILLAGHSSVKMSEHMSSTLKNNVLNFTTLLEKINDTQIIIYASSSSVYGDTKTREVTEEYDSFRPNNFYDLSKHEIDSYAALSGKCFFGLRFGTVNGYSQNLRNDIMINAMTFNAIENKKIFCFNPKINRPILGLQDLCRAIETIIEQGNKDNCGIYNLSSFNSNVETIARKVSLLTDSSLEIVDTPPEHITNVKLQSKAYDFLINSDKFKQTFQFQFEETIESIVQSLIDNYKNMVKGNRTNAKIY
jgi:nucleoside-diphosphate-sugar epimerase